MMLVCANIFLVWASQDKLPPCQNTLDAPSLTLRFTAIHRIIRQYLTQLDTRKFKSPEQEIGVKMAFIGIIVFKPQRMGSSFTLDTWTLIYLMDSMCYWSHLHVLSSAIDWDRQIQIHSSRPAYMPEVSLRATDEGALHLSVPGLPQESRMLALLL